ncbi:MAG: hypothetical protein JWO61_201 [Candidatus Saccharibacteria bacterium]|nr:hypothetical protein [Candidatus Saccharibacteria bacterium]
MDKIDEYLDSLPEWKKINLSIFRKLVHEVEPTVVEDWKWNVPVFLINGKGYFAMSAFKEHTKYNFMSNGALISDPDKLFNNGHDSKKSRGIDLREGQTINETDLKALIKSSVDD